MASHRAQLCQGVCGVVEELAEMAANADADWFRGVSVIVVRLSLGGHVGDGTLIGHRRAAHPHRRESRSPTLLEYNMPMYIHNYHAISLLSSIKH